jgi:hypothetical protein
MLHRCWCAAGTLLLALAIAANAASPGAPGYTLAGRWEGAIQTPAAPIAIVLDIARTSDAKASDGGWAGSAIFPAYGVKGAPLKDLSVQEQAVAFTVKDAPGRSKTLSPAGRRRNTRRHVRASRA